MKIDKLRYEYPLFRLVLIISLIFLLSACSGKTGNGKEAGSATGQEEAPSVRDKEQERTRLKSLAQQGEAGAQYMLGLCYAMGKGVSQDVVLAYKWFQLAAAQGDEEAADYRDDIAGSMLPEEIDKAEKMAGQWRNE
ncbi:MAG: tetratricopeptide repeat protein [Desulfurivibrionaceae bacterium]